MADLDPEFWDNNDYVYWCLADVPRTQAFRQSIRSVVKPGDIVVDLGAGTGVLGFTAAQCGAEKVYMVEVDPLHCEGMRQSARLNPFGDRIEVIQSDANSFILDRRADVLICEMIATALICEFQGTVCNQALKYCHEGTQHVPGRYRVFAELVHKPPPVPDMNLAIVAYDYWDTHPYEKTSEVLTDTVAYREFDFSKEVDLVVDETFALTVHRAGEVNGLRLWGATFLPGFGNFDGSTAFSTPVILPLKPRSTEPGEVFAVSVRYQVGGGYGRLKYDVSPRSQGRARS